jgi:hypothetical protein
MKEIKKERKTKYVNDADKKQHFKNVANKSIEIIDRQFVKLGKTARGRTFLYSPSQVEQISQHISEQTIKLSDVLLRKVEEKKTFKVGD